MPRATPLVELGSQLVVGGVALDDELDGLEDPGPG